jgi:replicative DNA helicase
MSAAWVGGTKTPPYSIHSEKAMLGGILNHPEIMTEVREMVTGADAFFRSQHGLIYESMLEVHGRAGTLNTDALLNALTESGTLDEVGGRGYLIELQQGAPDAASALAHARLVRDKTMLRKLIDVASDMLADAYGGRVEYDMILARARERLGALSPAPPPKPRRKTTRKKKTTTRKKTGEGSDE